MVCQLSRQRLSLPSKPLLIDKKGCKKRVLAVRTRFDQRMMSEHAAGNAEGGGDGGEDAYRQLDDELDSLLIHGSGVLAVVLGVDIVLGSLLGAHAAEHHDG